MGVGGCIYKYLSMGADFVGIGRPFGLFLNGKNDVKDVFDI